MAVTTEAVAESILGTLAEHLPGLDVIDDETERDMRHEDGYFFLVRVAGRDYSVSVIRE